MLRPGGAVGFVWHMREDSARGPRRWTGCSRPRPATSRATAPRATGRWSTPSPPELDAEVATRTTRWVHRVPPEAVVGRVASSSRIALLDEAGREPTSVRVRELLAAHPDTRGSDELDVSYLTSAYRLIPG